MRRAQIAKRRTDLANRIAKLHTEDEALSGEVRIPTMPPTYSEMIAPTIPR